MENLFSHQDDVGMVVPDLEALYDDITDRNRSQILAGHEYIDTTIDDPGDTRMGLTLTIRPHGVNGEAAASSISETLEKIRGIEPEQYFYPARDFHITLLDLITARSDFHYMQEQLQACIQIAETALAGMRPFAIQFRGLAISNAAVLVRGYYDVAFAQLRQRLRQAIDNSILPHDERYPARSAHMTVVRFRQALAHRQALFDFIEQSRDMVYGSIEVRQVELVYHNWFDSRKEKKKKFILVG